MHRKLLGERKQGFVFVVSAPAGTGKTTLVRMLTEEFDCVVESVSFTTRHARPTEIEGRDYHFITPEEFQAKSASGDFLEQAEVFGQHYGTSRTYVEHQTRQGKHVMLVIDTQGALQLMGHLDAIFIFISPPSLAELRKRLVSRKSESEEAVETRLSWAEREMSVASRYDYHIINDHLKTAYDALRAILIAEEHRIR